MNQMQLNQRNLYAIDAEIQRAIEAMFDTVNEDGEIEEGTAIYLSALREERAKKLDNVGAYIKNLEAETDAINAEIKRLQERAAVKKNRIERLKKYVSDSLLATGDMKFETGRVAYSFRKSTTVNITDADALPEKYVKIKTETSPDKTAIKKAIQGGAVIPGAILEEKQNLQIK